MTHAAGAAPQRDAGCSPLECSQLGGESALYAETPTETQRTAADRASWLAEIEAVSHRFTRAAAMLYMSTKLVDPDGIDDAAESIFAVVDDLAELLDAALNYDKRRGPSLEMLQAAAREYRAQRGDPVTIRAQPTTQRPNPPAPREPSARALAERLRLKSAYPAQFAGGEAAELARMGAPPGFAEWSADERAAFIAGATTVAETRLCRKAARDGG